MFGVVRRRLAQWRLGHACAGLRHAEDRSGRSSGSWSIGHEDDTGRLHSSAPRGCADQRCANHRPAASALSSGWVLKAIAAFGAPL